MKLTAEQRHGVYRLAYAFTWKGLRERIGCGMDRLHAVRAGADLPDDVAARLIALLTEPEVNRLCRCGVPITPTRFGKAQPRLCPTCQAASKAVERMGRQKREAARAARRQERLCACGSPVATPRSRHCHAHSNTHAPPAVGRVDTYAARVEACPRCGGKIQRDGVLVSCRRRLACGWVDLTSKAIRGHEVTP